MLAYCVCHISTVCTLLFHVLLLIQIEAAVLKAAAEGDSAALRQIHRDHPQAIPASRNYVGSAVIAWTVFVCGVYMLVGRLVYPLQYNWRATHFAAYHGYETTVRELVGTYNCRPDVKDKVCVCACVRACILACSCACLTVSCV